MKKILVVMGLIILTGLSACDRATSVSPSEVTNGDNHVVDVPTPGPRPDVVGSVERDEPTQCEIIDITARRVLSVSHESVTLRVTANYSGDGTVYARIIDAGSGRKLGDFPLGDITLRANPGEYRWFVFVEVARASGVIQCDGSVSFEIKRRTPPTCEELENCPLPPTCEERGDCPPPPCTDDDCGPPPQCITGDDCNPPPQPICFCHVSNEGRPGGDVNIQEIDQCLPAPAVRTHLRRHFRDYLGSCDGRSFPN